MGLFLINFDLITRLLPVVGLAIVNDSDPSAKYVFKFWEMFTCIGNTINSWSGFVCNVFNFLTWVMYAMYGAMLLDIGVHVFLLGFEWDIQK